MPVHFDQSGAIYIINLTTVLQHGNDRSIEDIGYAAMFEGDRSFARFGWSLALTDVNQDGVDDLLFSAPFRTEDITEELRGGLYILNPILGVGWCLSKEFHFILSSSVFVVPEGTKGLHNLNSPAKHVFSFCSC